MKIVVNKSQPKVHDTDYVLVHPEQLDEVEQASCTEVVITNTLDQYNYKDRISILQKILSKIRYGGEIFIEGIDSSMLASFIFRGALNNQELNFLLYEGRGSISDSQEMKNLLVEAGYKINVARLDKVNYFLRAERPHPNE